MTQQPVKALLMSVGGSPEPVICAINRLRPECLCFFVSEEAKGSIDRDIIPCIEQRPERWDQIVTPDQEDLKVCCATLLKDLPGLLKRWDVTPSDLVVDYTSGTRTMSAALVLCAIESSSQFHHGGGEGKAFSHVNPSDELAVKERMNAALVFNRGRYQQAADLFQKIEQRVSGGIKPLYKALADLSVGYALWDVFQYRQAWEKLQAARKALEMAALFGGPPVLKSLIPQLKVNVAFLEKIVMGATEVKPEMFVDLLANAERRAQRESNYEDAMVRLARALEVLAQVRLSGRGFQPGNIDPERLPVSLRQEYVQKYTSSIDGKVKVGLEAGYRLLKELGDELGGAFQAQWNTLRALLEARNLSILAHGFLPMKAERYHQLWTLVLKLSGTQSEQLPRFPKMDL